MWDELNTATNEEIAASYSHQRFVTTSDGIDFIVSTNDVVELTEQQFNDLAATVLRRKAEYIRKDGVDIASLNSQQVDSVLVEIKRILGDSKDPLSDSLINISNHISEDHASNTVTLQKRGWYRDTIQELYDDIVSVIKEAESVRKAIIKFHPNAQRTFPTFSFTVIGVKVNGDQGEVSIAFIEGDDDLILAVTII